MEIEVVSLSSVRLGFGSEAAQQRTMNASGSSSHTRTSFITVVNGKFGPLKANICVY